jgi:hypothetical protein
VSARDYIALIGASPRDRLDAFLATANRLGAPVGNIEKDFWICWTLDALYHQLPQGQPRLLFKGGTSLSKAYGLINRFSEDIDITVFRDDLNQAISVEKLEALSSKKRRAKLDAIRDACRGYITGPLRASLTGIVADATSGAGRVEIDGTTPTDKPCSSTTPKSSRAMGPMSARSSASSPAPNRRSIRIRRRRSGRMSPTRSKVSTWLFPM